MSPVTLRHRKQIVQFNSAPQVLLWTCCCEFLESSGRPAQRVSFISFFLFCLSTIAVYMGSCHMRKGRFHFLWPDTAIHDVLILVTFVLRLFGSSAFFCIAPLLYNLIPQWRLHRECNAQPLRPTLNRIHLTRRENGGIPV